MMMFSVRDNNLHLFRIQMVFDCFENVLEFNTKSIKT